MDSLYFLLIKKFPLLCDSISIENRFIKISHFIRFRLQKVLWEILYPMVNALILFIHLSSRYGILLASMFLFNSEWFLILVKKRGLGQLPVWAGPAVHDIPSVKVDCLESFSTKEYAGAKKTCAQDPKIVVPILRKEPT